MLGIKANDVYSATAFPSVVLNSRTAPPPKKKYVFETVPYMNGHYDFTEICGASAYDSREVKYVFVAVNENLTKLESTVSDVSQWLYGIADTEIYDDVIPGHHYVGTCKEVDVEWSGNGRIAKIKATFTCYPFRIANDVTSAVLTVGENVIENGGFPATLTAKPASDSAIIAIGGMVEGVSSETVLEARLPHGSVPITVSGDTVTLSWREEII